MKEVCRRKKDGLFDVTLRMYHGTETCELVGTFLKYMIDTTSVCIATTGCQYSKTKAALNVKE